MNFIKKAINDDKMTILDRCLIAFSFLLIVYSFQHTINDIDNINKRLDFIETVLNTDHQDLKFMYDPIE